MPNRCYNVVTAKWPKKDLSKYIKFLEDVKESNDWLFMTINPTPKELLVFIAWPRKEFGEDDALFKQRTVRHKKLYWATSWYDWNIKNWWTKWDVEIYDGCQNNWPNEHVVRFDSAWSPPEQAIAHLSKKFPDLKFTIEYTESWVFFSGRTVFKDWEIQEQKIFDDPRFGEWKKCEECWEEYGPDDECAWSEKYPGKCIDCEEVLDSKQTSDD